MLEDRDEADAAIAIRDLAARVDGLRRSGDIRGRSNKVGRIDLGSLNYYRYNLVPKLEDRHEIDAAIAIRNLADEVDRLRGNVVRDERLYRISLQKAKNERIHKGHKKPDDLP